MEIFIWTLTIVAVFAATPLPSPRKVEVQS
jgi:hypothetical protein